MLTHAAGVRDKLVRLDRVQDRQCGRAADGIAVQRLERECRGVVHYRLGARRGRDWKAAAEALAEDDDVGLDAQVLETVEAAAATESDLDLVADDEDAVAAADALDFMKEARGWDDHAPVRLDWLEKECRELAAVHFAQQPVEAIERPRGRRLGVAVSVGDGIRNKRQAGSP